MGDRVSNVSMAVRVKAIAYDLFKELDGIDAAPTRSANDD
jgi:hypothetical protein